MDDALSYLHTHRLVAKHRTLELLEPNGLHKTNGDFSSANVKENGLVNGHIEKNAESHICKSSDGSVNCRITNGEKATVLFGTERSDLEPTILCWSAADEMGIGRLTQSYENYFQSVSQIEKPQQFLVDLAFTLQSRRSNLPWKAFSVISHIDDLKHSIRESCSKPVRSSVGPSISYVFNGQGSQWVAMAQGLSSNLVFQTSLIKSRDYLLEMGCPWDAIEELHRDPKFSQIDEPEFAQPLCTVLQIALLQIFSSLGLKPIAVTGHSSGEIAAAYATSAISHRAAIQIAYYRGLMAKKLLKTSGLQGGMISVSLSANDIVPYLEDANHRTRSIIGVACINSPQNVTVSGDLDGINLLQTIMESKGIFARKLNVNIAYHSHHLHNVAAEYASALGKLEKGLPLENQTCMFSSVTGKQIDQQELLLPQYWVNNLVGTVKFSEALGVMSKHLMDVRRHGRDTKSGKDLLLEVGPHATLQRSIQDILKALPDVKEVEYEYSLMRNVSSILSLKKLAGRLWCRGCSIGFNAITSLSSNVSPPMALPDLPPYPFNHDGKYWYESRLSHNMRMRLLPKHDFLGIRETDWNPLLPRWRNVIKLSEHPWILDHAASHIVFFANVLLTVSIA